MALTLDIPPSLETVKRERLAVDLYDARLVSQSEAAEIAGLSRAEFIDVLGRYGVTPFQYDADEILADAARISEMETGQTG